MAFTYNILENLLFFLILSLEVCATSSTKSTKNNISSPIDTFWYISGWFMNKIKYGYMKLIVFIRNYHTNDVCIWYDFL